MRGDPEQKMQVTRVNSVLMYNFEAPDSFTAGNSGTVPLLPIKHLKKKGLIDIIFHSVITLLGHTQQITYIHFIIYISANTTIHFKTDFVVLFFF
jgi:hypothetical protein